MKRIYIVAISFIFFLFFVKGNVFATTYCTDTTRTVSCSDDQLKIQVHPNSGIDYQVPCGTGAKCTRTTPSGYADCFECQSTYTASTYTDTNISGTITIGTSDTVPSTMNVCVSFEEPGGNTTYTKCNDFNTHGEKTPGYFVSAGTNSKYNGQNATNVNGKVTINGQIGTANGGAIILGQSNIYGMSINLTGSKIPETTPNPADPNSCTSVNNINNAFKCLATCSGEWSQDYNHKTVNGNCSGGINCCYNPSKYPYGQIGSQNKSNVTPPSSGTTPGNPGGSGNNPPPSSACSSITVTNPDGAFNIDGYNKCKTTEDCFINAGSYVKPGFCDSISNRGVACGQNATNGIFYYCNKNQSCQTLSGQVYCTDNGTIQPGNGGNSCKVLDPATNAPKANDTVCTSGKCNPTSFTCDAVKPISSDPKTETAPCKNHGDIKTYINSTCGGELYNETVASAGKFCGQHYAERYICGDGTTEDWAISAQDPVCSSGAWCPAGSKKSGIATGCKDSAGKDLDCSTRGPGWVCTEDYPLDISGTKNVRCTPPGTRYCDGSISNVFPSQGCGSPYAGQGTSCYIPDPTGKDTLGNCEPNQNLECKTINNVKTCQYIQDSSGNPVMFTPTPGNPETNACDPATRLGHFPAGCKCYNGGGCGPLLGCYPALDNDAPGNYCSPADHSAGTWCVRKQTLVSDNSCTSGAGITPSPTPPDLSWQYDCPWDATLGNICLPTCGSNLQPNTKLGRGGTTGDKACSYSTPGTSGYNNTSNPTGAVCCVPKTTLPSPVSTNPTPATGGGSVACPNTATEQCQQEGTAPNWGCLGGWTQTGKTCPAPSVCCKQPSI